jgi:CheY-like chemotaxis protein
MKNLLLVDDESSFLLSLTDMLQEYKDKFYIVTANNGREAVEVLGAKPIDLVVTDLKMPEMDGFELLSHLASEYPHIPVIVMTAFGTPDVEDRLHEMGAFQYIEKPLDFDVLLEKIVAGLADSDRGRITGFSISSFLQLLAHEKKTGTLTVRAQDKEGLLYFMQGELIQAETSTLSGLEAAMDIVGWEQPEIEIQNTCREKVKKIAEPLGFIIIESVRRRDERESPTLPDNSQDFPDLDAINQLSEEDIGSLNPNFRKERVVAEDDECHDDLTNLSQLPNGEDLYIHAASTDTTKEKINKSVVDSLFAIDGVTKMIMVSRDGVALARKNLDDPQYGTFIAFVEVVAERLKDVLGFRGPRYIVMSRISGQKLLIVSQSKNIFGLELGTGIAPGLVVDALENIINQSQR